jgi:hypothetical protein
LSIGIALRHGYPSTEAGDSAVLLVFCECGHSGAMSFDGLPDDLPVPDVALWLVCSACGRRDRVSTRTDFSGALTRAPG